MALDFSEDSHYVQSASEDNELLYREYSRSFSSQATANSSSPRLPSGWKCGILKKYYKIFAEFGHERQKKKTGVIPTVWYWYVLTSDMWHRRDIRKKNGQPCCLVARRCRWFWVTYRLVGYLLAWSCEEHVRGYQAKSRYEIRPVLPLLRNSDAVHCLYGALFSLIYSVCFTFPFFFAFLQQMLYDLFALGTYV